MSSKRAGRPRIHPIGRKRHNINIERSAKLEHDLFAARQMIASARNVAIGEITQRQAVEYALEHFVLFGEKA